MHHQNAASEPKFLPCTLHFSEHHYTVYQYRAKSFNSLPYGANMSLEGAACTILCHYIRSWATNSAQIALLCFSFSRKACCALTHIINTFAESCGPPPIIILRSSCALFNATAITLRSRRAARTQRRPASQFCTKKKCISLAPHFTPRALISILYPQQRFHTTSAKYRSLISRPVHLVPFFS